MNFETRRFFLQTLDPVHVGTGGTRLGRVDLSIVREPGTRLPKIPGTSFSGAIRAYAAYRYGKRRCAGQGQSGEGHCGRPTCPICYTFGAITGERSYSGVVSIGDARILLFPVYSMVGPVWVTSPTALQDAGCVQNDVSVNSEKAKWGGNGSGLPTDKPINLGWLMVEREDDLPSMNLPSQIPEQIRKRIVLVSNELFSHIVNSNLEVRTSVSINPETGAAEEGALFTYEAIPRATVLWMDVVVDDYKNRTLWQGEGIVWRAYREERTNDQGEHDNSQQGGPLYPDPQQPEQPQRVNGEPKGWRSPSDVIAAGLEWCKHLGIGGMGTRGFGRIRKLADCTVQPDETSSGPCSEQDNANTDAESTTGSSQ